MRSDKNKPCQVLSVKRLIYIYLTFLILGTMLPINGTFALNDNYVLNIRWDYLLHVLVYIPLPVLLIKQTEKFWLAMLLSFAIAAGFEFVQLTIAFRAFNINDLLANVVGILAGVLVYFLLRNKNFSKLKKIDLRK